MYPLIGTPTVERRNSLGSLGISDIDNNQDKERYPERDQLSRDNSLLRNQVRLLLGNMVDTPQGTPSLSPDTRQQQQHGDSLGLRSNGSCIINLLKSNNDD
jgi:hypothetical protein